MNERELLDAVGRLPKSIEPPRDLWPDIAARIGGRRRAWRRRWYWVPLAAAAVLAGVWLVRSQPASWDVTKLAGRPVLGTTPLAATGRLRVGDWLQTDDSSRALIAVGRIGQVEVQPETRVQLVAATETDHRLALARGTIDAKVDAVPRLFFVETPAGTAIDLGCAYTLQTDSLGTGLLHVTGGEVEFQTGRRSARVPLGALAQLRPVSGPGIPYVEDAPAPLVRAPALATFAPSPITRGAKWLELTPSTPASCLDTVPFLTSVVGPSIRNVTARRARDMPPLPCVPEMRPNRM